MLVEAEIDKLTENDNVAIFAREIFKKYKSEGKVRSLRDFASLLSVRHQSVSLWMKGGVVPDAESRKALAKIAGISVDELNEVFAGRTTLQELIQNDSPIPLTRITRSLAKYTFQDLIALQNKITFELSQRGTRIDSSSDVQSSAETKKEKRLRMREYVDLNSKELSRLRNLVVETAIVRGWIERNSVSDIVGAMIECEGHFLGQGVDRELFRQVGRLNASGFTRGMLFILARTLLKTSNWEGDKPVVSRQSYRDLDELLRDLTNGTGANAFQH